MSDTSIKDVALRAGVSITTVSRVMNNRGYISSETKKKVHSAMEELAYYPNEVARNLLRNCTYYIGLIIPDISHPFFSLLTKHIEINLHSKSYRMMLCNSIDKSNREKEYLEMLQRNKVDGIIIASHTLNFKDYEKVRLPIMAIDQDLGENIPIVSSDHYKGGIIAAQKLISSGCKKIAQIKGYSKVHTPSHERHIAFENELKDAGIEFTTLELGWNQFKFEQYEKPIRELFDSIPDIDGIFAADLVAAAVIKEAYKRGIKVPAQLKIIGYDGTDIARIITPSLTTIQQPIDKIAKHSVDTILKLIQKEEIVNRHLKLDVELIEGETT